MSLAAGSFYTHSLQTIRWRDRLMQDPLRSYFDERQKNEIIYFLNIYTRHELPQMNLFWTNKVHTMLNNNRSHDVKHTRRHG